MSSRSTIIPSVFLLLHRENRILLQRRFQTGFADGQYTFISGHIEAGESPTQAVCREAKEEAGIVVNPEDLRFLQVLYRPSLKAKGDEFDHAATERVDFFFTADRWEGMAEIKEPDKCDELKWFDIGDLPENLFVVVREFLRDYDQNPPYQEMGY